MNVNTVKLDDLLKFNGPDFVTYTYKMILDRLPDDRGFCLYIEQLHRGVDPVEIIWQLSKSKEAQEKGVSILGLDKAVRRLRWLNLPLLGRLLRRLGVRSHRLSRRMPVRLAALLPPDAPRVQNPGQPSHALRDLLSLTDAPFVTNAYHSILGREPDADGFQDYLARIRAGKDRREILWKMRNSAEGRRHKATIDGLDQELRAFRRQNLPIIGRAIRVVSERRTGRSTQEHLRSLESQLFQVAQGVIDVKQHLSPSSQPCQTTSSDSGEKAAPTPAVQPSIPLTFPRTGEKILFCYVGNTAGLDADTRASRMVRKVGRAWLEIGRVVRFVKWNEQLKTLVLITRREARQLAHWNGPDFTEEDLSVYPDDDASVVIEANKDRHDDWLIVPDVTYTSHSDQDAVVDIIRECRARGLLVGFVYHDAIPLRLKEYHHDSDRHDLYMQALLLADLVLPVSGYADRELRLYFDHWQHASHQPKIVPVPLAGEASLAPRVREPLSAPIRKHILCVSSAEPRENLAASVQAFIEFSTRPEGQGWSLTVAGNASELFSSQMAAASQDHPSIRHLPHPTDEELAELYRQTDFTLFPSHEEGFAQPVLDSLWFGRPCLCADSSVMAEMAEDGGCLAVNIRDHHAIADAMSRLATEPDLLASLSHQAVGRPISTWCDYSVRVSEALDRFADPSARLRAVYYWVGSGPDQPMDNAIQWVARHLARSLIDLGLKLIPTSWNADKSAMAPASADRLAQLAKNNGPDVQHWAEWVEPGADAAPDWLVMAELDAGLKHIQSLASRLGMRVASVFHGDAAGQSWDGNRADYLYQVYSSTKVLCTSEPARQSLYDFLLSTPRLTPDVEHRLGLAPIPLELPGQPRTGRATDDDDGAVHLICKGRIGADQLRLLDAFAVAAAHVSATPGITLTFVGDAVDADFARQMTQRVSQIAGCRWLTTDESGATQDLYGPNSVAVYPSLSGEFGVPVVEALWHGRPCLVHRDGLMVRIIRGGGIMAADMTDPAALADILISLAQVPKLRRELARQARSHSGHGWADYAQTVARLLADERLLDRREKIKPAADTKSVTDGDILAEFPNLTRRPKLSVCISTYNRAGWLGVNLRNIFGQLIFPNPDVEVLVVDNTSTDNTPEVVQPYLNRPDFRFVRNPKNVGMLGNLTITAHRARGDYVWILGDDDLVKKGGIQKILDAINAHPGLAMVYPNYAYTHEKDPANVVDLYAFLDSCPAIAPSTPDAYLPIKGVAVMNENLFTGIYSMILRRDHAMQAYSQDSGGSPFSSMCTAIPTTYYVLNYMMEEMGYWIGTPTMVVNFNVSWNQYQYASLFILERFPEAHDLAERMGADPAALLQWRLRMTGGGAHYWNEIYRPEHDSRENWQHFSPERTLMRLKGGNREMLTAMRMIYRNAAANGHAMAKIDENRLFAAFDLQEGA